MIRREIELDEESDRILSGLAQGYDGDLSKALRDVLQVHETMEAFVEQCEDAHRDSLLAQKERAERGFRQGQSATWDEIKRRNEL